MNEIMELINRKFLKPHNAHYNEYLVVIDNNGQDEEYIVCCKFK